MGVMNTMKLVWVRECQRFAVYPRKTRPFLLLCDREPSGVCWFYFPNRGAYAGIRYRQSVEIVRPFVLGEAVAEHPTDPIKYVEAKVSP